jgi:hypothetical protein
MDSPVQKAITSSFMIAISRDSMGTDRQDLENGISRARQRIFIILYPIWRKSVTAASVALRVENIALELFEVSAPIAITSDIKSLPAHAHNPRQQKKRDHQALSYTYQIYRNA